MNARTKRIFSRLKRRLSSGIDSPILANERRPSAPPRFEEETIDDSIVPKPGIENKESTSRSHIEIGQKSSTMSKDFDNDRNVANVKNYCLSPIVIVNNERGSGSHSGVDSPILANERRPSASPHFEEETIDDSIVPKPGIENKESTSRSHIEIGQKSSTMSKDFDNDRNVANVKNYCLSPIVIVNNERGSGSHSGVGVQSPAGFEDFDSDDSVADRNYCPSPSSTDSENEYRHREKAKRFLFHEDLITLEDLIEADRSCTSTVQPETTRQEQADYDRIDPYVESTNQVDNEPLRHDVALGDPFQSPLNITRPTAESSTKKNPRKRPKNEDKWQKNVVKKARLLGQSYTSKVAKKKKDVKARSMKPSCKCRAKCFEKVSEQEREYIFKTFWAESVGWEQRRQYVADRINKTTKIRTRVDSSFEEDKRKYNFNYHLQVNGELISVCKVMFLNTLSIGDKYVKITMKKKEENGLTESDQRGKHVPSNKTSETIVTSVTDHIRSYPSYESHYTRQKSRKRYLGPELNVKLMYDHYEEKMKAEGKSQDEYAKQWLFREIFNTKFNLSFKLPGIDTCDECDKLNRLVKEENDTEKKEEIMKEKRDHLQKAQLRYDLKAKDKSTSYADKSKRVLFLDLQKCLPTPSLTNTQSFYLRKLWTLNLVIYDASTKETHNFVWPENVAGRGGNEIASCILVWCQKHLDNTIEELTIWTDNCAGQNRNHMVIACYHVVFALFPNVKRINHKFLLKGHTHMEVDHVHSMIERKKKRLNTMDISIPHDWAQFIATCAGRNPFYVTEMSFNDFKDFTHLFKRTGALIHRKKDTQGNDFKISCTVWWQVQKETPGFLFYKTEFEDNFKKVNMNRYPKKQVAVSPLLPNVRETQKPISTLKYRDLQTLLNWVPAQFHAFYTELPHLDDMPDAPEAFQESEE